MSRRGWWLIGGISALVVIAAGLWFWQSTTRTPTPEEAARGYLHALESGDPEAVAATGISVSATALDAFGAASALIEDAEVTTVREEPDGSSATVEIAFRLEDEPERAQLVLTPVEGRWTVDDSGLGTLTADSTIGSDVAIGEITTPARETIALLPAGYTVAAAPTALLSGGTAARVLPGDHATAEIDAALRPEATTAAQSRLDEHLEACTTPAAEPPDGCGIRIPWGTEFREVTDIRYRIDESPTIALTPTSFAADGGVLVATVTGTGQDGTARTTTYRTESWTLRGEVSFTAEGIALSAW